MANQPKKIRLEPDTGHTTQPSRTPSEEQHAALGKRRMGASTPKSGYTTETEDLGLVEVPASPQADSALPPLEEGDVIITGDVSTEDIPSPQPEAREAPGPRPEPKRPPSRKGETIPAVRMPQVPPVGAIWWLGGGLILANAIVGGAFAPLLSKVWNTPEKQGSQTQSARNQAFELAGTILFLLILATIARIFPSMTRPIVIFLLGLWTVWIIFTVPQIQKQGIHTMFGQLFGQQTATEQHGTTPTSAPGHGKSSSPHGGGYELGYRGVAPHRPYPNIIGV